MLRGHFCNRIVYPSRNLDESHRCEKPAPMFLRYPSGATEWLCAEHYDETISMWRRRILAGTSRFPIDEVRYRNALRLNQEAEPL